MQRSICCAALSLCLLTPFCFAEGDQKISLKPKYEVGQEAYMEWAFEHEWSYTPQDGKNIPDYSGSHTLVIGVIERVEWVSPVGGLKFSYRFDRIAETINTEDLKEQFDSDVDRVEDVKEPRVRAQGAIAGLRTTIELDRNGEYGNFQDPVEVRKHIQALVTDKDIVEKMSGLIDGTNLSHNLLQLQFIYPNRAVSPGDAWQERLSSERMSYLLDYRLEQYKNGKGQPLAVVEYTAKPEPGSFTRELYNQMGPDCVVEEAGFKGTATIDKSTGRIVSNSEAGRTIISTTFYPEGKPVPYKFVSTGSQTFREISVEQRQKEQAAAKKQKKK